MCPSSFPPEYFDDAIMWSVQNCQGNLSIIVVGQHFSYICNMEKRLGLLFSAFYKILRQWWFLLRPFIFITIWDEALELF